MSNESPSNAFRSGPPREVEANEIEIGLHPLPPRPSGEEDGGPRRIPGPILLWGDSGRNLFWIEEDDDEEEVPMIWLPETEDERQAAFKLFDKASNFMDSPEVDEDDPTWPARSPRRFLSTSSDPPDLRTLTASEDRLDESSGPIGSAPRTESRETSDVDAALAERASELIARGYVEIVPLEKRIVAAFPPARVDGDPGYWSRVESWERVRDLIARLVPKLSGYVPPDPAGSIAAFEAEWQFPIPPSYKAFLRVFGPGDARECFFTLFPAGGPWKESIVTKTKQIRVASESMDFVSQEYARLEPMTRMIVFCSDFAGNQFGWDPDEPTDVGAGEFAILERPRGRHYLERTASSFPEFFLESLLQDARKILDRSPHPTFHPNPPDSA